MYQAFKEHFVYSQNEALNIKGKKQTKKKNIYSWKHKYPVYRYRNQSSTIVLTPLTVIMLSAELLIFALLSKWCHMKVLSSTSNGHQWQYTEEIMI